MHIPQMALATKILVYTIKKDSSLHCVSSFLQAMQLYKDS